ncbi:MAG: hypothetical protein AAGI44_06625 [Pseudomonadota bacterium]
MIDQHHFFAFAAIALATARYITYFITIYQGKTKPHAFSWLLWGLLTGIGALAQFELEGGPSAWALAFVALTCLLISFLSLFIGERDYKKSDWLALFACLFAIPVWKLTDNPVAALAIIIMIDSFSYWPTVRKSYHKPETEPPISYGLAGMRYFLILFAVPEPSWELLVYPLFLMLTDWGFALYIVVRRIQLGFPAHEYASNRASSG